PLRGGGLPGALLALSASTRPCSRLARPCVRVGYVAGVSGPNNVHTGEKIFSFSRSIPLGAVRARMLEVPHSLGRGEARESMLERIHAAPGARCVAHGPVRSGAGV